MAWEERKGFDQDVKPGLSSARGVDRKTLLCPTQW